MDLAKRSLNEVAIRVAEVDPEQRDEGDVRYHQVEAQWKKLYGMIGLTGTMGGAFSSRIECPTPMHGSLQRSTKQ